MGDEPPPEVVPTEEGPPAEEAETITGCCPRYWLFLKCYWPSLVVILAPAVCAAVFAIPSSKHKDIRCLYVALVMFIYWIAEPTMPLGITAFIPIVFFPSMGILPVDPTCLAYLREANIIFVGCYILTVCIMNSGLHVRLVLKWMMIVGCTHSRMTFALISVTAFEAMFVSSHFATHMLVPHILEILKSMEQAGVCRYSRPKDADDENSEQVATKTSACYLLGFVYAANIGGTITIMGHVVNMATRTLIYDYFNDTPKAYLQFQRWFVAAIGPAILMLIVVWVWLNSYFLGWKGFDDADKIAVEGEEETTKDEKEKIHDILNEKYAKLGPVKFYEIISIFLVFLLIFSWIFREPVFFRGWASILSGVFKPIVPQPAKGRDPLIKDAVSLIIVVFLINVMPTNLAFLRFCGLNNENRPVEAGPRLIQWKPASKQFIWNIFFVIGGGFSLYTGMRDTGLVTRLHFDAFKNLHEGIILVAGCVITLLLTQVIDSNCVIFMVAPFFMNVCSHAKVKGYHVIAAIGVCCSLGFIFPWRTSSNAIVHHRLKVPIKQYMAAGSVPLVAALVFVVPVYMFVGKIAMHGR